MSSRSRHGVHFTQSDFYCTKCGSLGVPIQRRTSKQRAAGHLKKLYCIHCKEEVNHVEVRPFDYTKEQLLEDIKNGKYKEEESNEQESKKCV